MERVPEATAFLLLITLLHGRKLKFRKFQLPANLIASKWQSCGLHPGLRTAGPTEEGEDARAPAWGTEGTGGFSALVLLLTPELPPPAPFPSLLTSFTFTELSDALAMGQREPIRLCPARARCSQGRMWVRGNSAHLGDIRDQAPEAEQGLRHGLQAGAHLFMRALVGD